MTDLLGKGKYGEVFDGVNLATDDRCVVKVGHLRAKCADAISDYFKHRVCIKS